jgi:hypothetical protein
MGYSQELVLHQTKMSWVDMQPTKQEAQQLVNQIISGTSTIILPYLFQILHLPPSGRVAIRLPLTMMSWDYLLPEKGTYE